MTQAYMPRGDANKERQITTWTKRYGKIAIAKCKVEEHPDDRKPADGPPKHETPDWATQHKYKRDDGSVNWFTGKAKRKPGKIEGIKAKPGRRVPIANIKRNW